MLDSAKFTPRAFMDTAVAAQHAPPSALSPKMLKDLDYVAEQIADYFDALGNKDAGDQEHTHAPVAASPRGPVESISLFGGRDKFRTTATARLKWKHPNSKRLAAQKAYLVAAAVGGLQQGLADQAGTPLSVELEEDNSGLLTLRLGPHRAKLNNKEHCKAGVAALSRFNRHFTAAQNRVVEGWQQAIISVMQSPEITQTSSVLKASRNQAAITVGAVRQNDENILLFAELEWEPTDKLHFDTAARHYLVKHAPSLFPDLTGVRVTASSRQGGYVGVKIEWMLPHNPAQKPKNPA